ncbi:hypothetical protein [Streptomyces zhihengii]
MAGRGTDIKLGARRPPAVSSRPPPWRRSPPCPRNSRSRCAPMRPAGPRSPRARVSSGP